MVACSCQAEAQPCQECYAAAVDVVAAVSGAYEGKRARGVNEIEFADVHGMRVFVLRRESDGGWCVADVRPMGSAERDRCRPQSSSA